MIGLESFMEWVANEVDFGGDRSGELDTVFVSNVLGIVSLLPSMLSSPSTSPYLYRIREFCQSTLIPRFENTSSSISGANSATLRKMAVKAEGRWWVARLGGSGNVSERRRAKVLLGNAETKGKDKEMEDVAVLTLLSLANEAEDDLDELEQTDFEAPDGFEEALDKLMETLSDRVSSKSIKKRSASFTDSSPHRILSSDIQPPNTYHV